MNAGTAVNNNSEKKVPQAARPGPGPANAATWLAQLSESHQWMREAIEMIEIALRVDPPSAEETIRGRWQLSRIERKRRAIVDEVIAALPPGEAPRLEPLEALRRETEAYLRNYVWKWSPEVMQGDWSGYRAAFADKRQRIMAMIDQEQVVLSKILVAQGGR